MKKLFFLLFLFALTYALFTTFSSAHADIIWKKGALTCDEHKNLAMVRLNLTANDNPMPAVRLPAKYAEKFGALNSLPISTTCKLEDGKILSLSYEENQYVSGAGAGSGDTGATFTLAINGKKAFFDKTFYSGGGNHEKINLYVLLFDGKSLTSCAEPTGGKESEQTPQIKEQDCTNVSSRLSGQLPEDEDSALMRAEAQEKYQDVVLDKKLCDHFADKENWHNDLDDVQDINHAEGFPAIKLLSSNVLNSGQSQTTYYFYGDAGGFHGSYIAYFPANIRQQSFADCVEGGICPKDSNFTLQDDAYFMKNAPKAWPGIHILDGDDLAGLGYSGSYTHVYPVTFEGKTYLRFSPHLRSSFPHAAIGKLENGSIKALCTYKEMQDQW